MKKKGQTGIVLGILGLIVLGVVGFFIFGNVQQTVFGVSNVEVLGEGDRVLITTSVGSGVENVVVELTQSQLNSELQGDGWSVDRGVLIELDLIDFNKIYNLNLNSDQNFRTIDFQNTGNTFLSGKQDMIEECRTDRGLPQTIDATTNGVLIGFRDLYCFVPRIFGTNGDFSGTSINDFSVQVTSGTDTELITRTTPTANLNNGDVQVSFEGLLQAPQDIEEVPFNVFWKDGQFRFLIGEQSETFTIESDPETRMRSCTSGISVDNTLEEYTNCMNQYNTQMLNSIQDRTDEFSPTIVSDVDFSGTQMIVDVRENSITSFPVVRIIVDGDFLGIDRLSGEPNIVNCVDDVNDKNGDSVIDSLSVKNTGNERASFDVSITCNNPKITVSSSNLISSINPDETETISVRTSGFSDNPNTVETAVCSVKVTDRNSGSSDSCSYNVRYEFADVICQPNQRLCSEDGNEVLECSFDGTETNVVETCESDEICGSDSSGKVTCIEEGSIISTPSLSTPDFGLKLPSFSNLISSFSGILLLIIVGIIGIAIIIIGLNVLPFTRTLFRR